MTSHVLLPSEATVRRMFTNFGWLPNDPVVLAVLDARLRQGQARHLSTAVGVAAASSRLAGTAWAAGADDGPRATGPLLDIVESIALANGLALDAAELLDVLDAIDKMGRRGVLPSNRCIDALFDYLMRALDWT